MKITKNNTIAFLGYQKPLSEREESDIHLHTKIINSLYKIVEGEYTENGIINFMAEMSSELDYLTGLAITEIRLLHPDIKFIVVIPYHEYQEALTPQEQEYHKNIHSLADCIIALHNSATTQAATQAALHTSDFLTTNATKVYTYQDIILSLSDTL